MLKTLPDKYVRKAIQAVLNGIEVNGHTINCYTYRVSGVDDPSHYILMTTQTNIVDNLNKCEDVWDSSILIDVVTRFTRQGNPSTKTLADDIMDEVRNLTNDLTLTGGLEVIEQKQSFPQEFNDISDEEVVYRKLMRLELKIK